MAKLNDRLARLEAVTQPKRRTAYDLPREHAVALGVASEQGYFQNLHRLAEAQAILEKEVDVITVDQWTCIARLARELIATEEPLGGGWACGDAAARARQAREDMTHYLGPEWARKEHHHAST